MSHSTHPSKEYRPWYNYEGSNVPPQSEARHRDPCCATCFTVGCACCREVRCCASSCWTCSRRLVSKKKHRMEKDGVSLDLVYLSQRVVIFGFPAYGPEQIWRNPYIQLRRFFDQRHGEKLKIYNFCNEPGRVYPASRFSGPVAHYGFFDHNVPSLEMMVLFSENSVDWLAESASNAIGVHCKAGKGRSGLMACVLMLRLGMKPIALDVLDYYDEVRVKNKKGLSQPSQRRWVELYGSLLTRARAMRKELEQRRASDLRISTPQASTARKATASYIGPGSAEVESPPTEGLLVASKRAAAQDKDDKDEEKKETPALHEEHVVMRVRDEEPSSSEERGGAGKHHEYRKSDGVEIEMREFKNDDEPAEETDDVRGGGLAEDVWKDAVLPSSVQEPEYTIARVDVSAAPSGKSWCMTKTASAAKVTLLQGFRMQDVLLSRSMGPLRMSLGVRGHGCLHMKISWNSGPTTKLWIHTDLTLYPWYDREAHALAYGLPAAEHLSKAKDAAQEFPPDVHRVGPKVPPPPVANAAGTRSVLPLVVHWNRENSAALGNVLPGSAPLGTYRLVFRKWQLEKLCKDKKHVAVPEDFLLVVTMATPVDDLDTYRA